MKKKLMCLITIMVLMSTSFVAVASNIEHDDYHSLIISEIDNIKNRKLTADSTFGNIDVKYYEHYINGFKVVNDRILFQTYSGTDDVIKYEKEWRNVDSIIIPCNDIVFQPKSSYKTKEKIVFLNEKDLGYFYTINGEMSYPLFCWKVLYENGETILYDYFDVKKIGYGIPAPSSKGLALNGYEADAAPNGYASPFRTEAAKWFRKWGLNTEELSLPSPSDVSSRVIDSSVKCWYNICHGNSYGLFLNKVNGEQLHYFSYSPYDDPNARDDMKNRPPLNFAFIGSCDGMTFIDEDSFAYIFRKGETDNTVVVGYWDLGGEDGPNGPFWGSGQVMTWQNNLFKYLYEGDTFEEAYNKACADAPASDHDVRWVGDGSLTLDVILNEKPNKPDTPTGLTEGIVKEEYVFYSRTTDPNGDELYYQWDWDDGATTNWQGPYSSGEQINSYHAWESEDGYYDIKVRAKDEHGEISEWSNPHTIHIQNQPPTTPNKPNGPNSLDAEKEYAYTTSATDPEEQRIRYIFNWGDGKQTNTDYIASGSNIEARHSWEDAGNYEIKVKAQDEGGEESGWSEPLSITVTRNKKSTTNSVFFSRFFNVIIKKIVNMTPVSKQVKSFPIFNIIKKIDIIEKNRQEIVDEIQEKKYDNIDVIDGAKPSQKNVEQYDKIDNTKQNQNNIGRQV